MKKKLKSLIVCTALAGMAVLAGSANTARAASEGGVRGGGHVVDVNERPELLDLLPRTGCTWKSGATMIEEHPYVERVLERIAALDWYLAGDLRHEIRFLNYCFTGRIYAPQAIDDRSFLHSLLEQGVQQVAYRQGSEVFIDGKLMSELSERSQAFLLFHEAAHSYFSMDLPRRMDRLRGMIHVFSQIEKGEITYRQTLHEQMRMGGFEFPRTVASLDPYRKVVEFVVGDDDERRAMVLASAAPEELIAADPAKIVPYLSEWDRLHVSFKSQLVHTIADILVLGSDAEFASILQSKRFDTIDPALIAISRSASLSASKRATLSASTRIPERIASIVAGIDEVSVTAGAYRLQVSAELAELVSGGSYAGTTDFTSLAPRSRACPRELSMSIRALVQLTAWLAAEGQWDEIERDVARNAAFLDAISLRSLAARIEAIPASGTLARDKALALRLVPEMGEGLKSQFAEQVSDLIKPEDRARWKALLPAENFEE